MVYKVEESKSLVIDLTAKANPDEIEYKWTDPDRSTVPEASEAQKGTRITAKGGELNVTDAKRDDAGKYKLKATNSEGKSTAKIRLDVQYEPR
jgi:hypothetical protein